MQHKDAQCPGDPDPDFEGWRRLVVITSGWVLGALAIVAISAMLLSNLSRGGFWAKLIIITAAIAPPTYFWFEYFVIWRGARQDKRPPLDQYKYGQETSRNIWLAFVGLLIALLLKSGN